jgi:hypothetical protein
MAAPFTGITTDGNVVPGLYALRKTGISVPPSIDAADAFVASLTSDGRATASFEVDSVEWRNRGDTHPCLCRHGVCRGDLADQQRNEAVAEPPSAGHALRA